MDKIALSDYQRSSIKRKRKEIGIRTDDLSKEIGKAACYMSQIESGKIKKVQRETLETIITSLRSASAQVAEWRNLSISSFIAESFSI